jgi:hypothetical protein
VLHDDAYKLCTLQKHVPDSSASPLPYSAAVVVACSPAAAVLAVAATHSALLLLLQGEHKFQSAAAIGE